MRETFFTSDTHFGHRNIIEHCSRPFSNVDEMDEELIRNWNDRVTNNDVVYHLGDFSFHGNKGRVAEIIGSLNGRKHLVLGNHDAGLPNWLLELFEWAVPYSEIKLDGLGVTLCHFPMVNWNRERSGGFMLHGHTHGSLDNAGVNRYDVGVDSNNYAPVTFDEIREAVSIRKPALTRARLATMKPAEIARLDWAEVRRVLANG